MFPIEDVLMRFYFDQLLNQVRSGHYTKNEGNPMSFHAEIVDFGKYVVWEVVEENEMVSGYSIIISLEENFLCVLTFAFLNEKERLVL